MSPDPDYKRAKAFLRLADKAANFPTNTDSASRHVYTMADQLIRFGDYPLFEEEPCHCAISLLATVKALWEARTELAALKLSCRKPSKPRAQPRRHAGKGKK